MASSSSVSGALLAQFVTFAEESGAELCTVDLALAWARLPAGARPIWVARRLEVVRVFSRHLAVIDPANEVIPADLFAVRVTRRAPYLYAPEEIAAWMESARQLPNPLKAATFETLVGLLACTGLRAGEAMRLDRSDFDAERSLLTVRNSKFNNYAEHAVMPRRRESAVLDMADSHDVLGIIAMT